MGSTELIANLFRISQTEEKLIRDNIQTEKEANITYYNVGAKVRKNNKGTWWNYARRFANTKKEFKTIRKRKRK